MSMSCDHCHPQVEKSPRQRSARQDGKNFQTRPALNGIDESFDEDAPKELGVVRIPRDRIGQ